MVWEDPPTSGDQIVENVVENIRHQGICLHFRLLFNEMCTLSYKAGGLSTESLYSADPINSRGTLTSLSRVLLGRYTLIIAQAPKPYIRYHKPCKPGQWGFLFPAISQAAVGFEVLTEQMTSMVADAASWVRLGAVAMHM